MPSITTIYSAPCEDTVNNSMRPCKWQCGLVELTVQTSNCFVVKKKLF